MPPNPKTPMSAKIRPEMFGTSADLPRISELDIEKIAPNPDQPRKYFDEESLKELAASIESRGLLQPILVRVGEGDTYIVVAGERRYRAHKLLNKATIPAIITNGDSDELALIENMQRENLTPIEEAEGIKRLIDKHGYLHEDAARIVGKARNTVTSLLKILTLPEDILAECKASNIATKTVLIELAGVPAEQQREIWDSLKSGKTRTRNAVRGARGVKEDSNEKEPDTPFEKALRAVKICTRTLQAAAGQLNEEEMAEILRAKSELDEIVLNARYGAH
jgi:ParB family chromosome partitioning protein